MIKYEGGEVSVFYGQDKDPFWRYTNPDDKVLIKGTMEVLRKLRRMGREAQEWTNRFA